MSTYSFLEVVATIAGPSGSANLGAGSAATDEGITVAPADDTNTMTIGADGSGMHSLHANKSGEITVRLLKTSPMNAVLLAMYNAQRVSAVLHGQNTILITNLLNQDTIACRGVAFKRHPDLTYDKVGAMVEWRFDALKIDTVLGINPTSYAGGV